MNRKGFAQIIVLLVVAGLLAIAGSAWYYEAHKENVVPPLTPPCCKTTIISTSTLARSTTTINTTTAVAEPPSVTITANLENELLQQNYLISSATASWAPLWWVDKSGIAVNVSTTDYFSIFITQTAQENYDIPQSNSTDNQIENAPMIAGFIKIINSYMNARGLTLQENESNNIAHPYVGSFSQAYYNSNNDERCRLTIQDPNLGVDEPTPYTFIGTIACADKTAYQTAYKTQAPMLQALAPAFSTNGGYPISHDVIIINSVGTTPCTNNPSLEEVMIIDLTQGSTGYYYMQDMSGTWINSNISSYDAWKYDGCR